MVPTDGETSAALRDVRVLFGAGAVGGASDAQLLEWFRARGAGRGHDEAAEAAFAVLVARHGPMVLGVCRRALRDPDDAADAFQATFLVLVRKAGAVRVGDSLGRWLYGVSRRVAARARVAAARRAAREASRLGPDPPAPADDPDRGERLAALDEEVARLPEPFRAAVVLCDLGGLTHEAAARQLGCPVGTVESRLSRGRSRLRDRLTRRGLGAAVIGSAPTAVPPALSVSTVQAAATDKLAVGAVSSSVLTLTQGVLKDMAWTRLKTLAMACGAAAACSVVTLAAHRMSAGDAPERTATATKRRAEPRVPEKPVKLEEPAKVQPGDRLLIEVLEALPGRPITGERLVRPDGTISLGFYGDVQVAGLNRTEIKVKIIEHLLKVLPEEILGLVAVDAISEKPYKIAPADSNRVFVDDTLIYEPPTASAQGGDLSRKLDRVLKAVESLDAPARRVLSRNPSMMPVPAPAPDTPSPFGALPSSPNRTPGVPEAASVALPSGGNPSDHSRQLAEHERRLSEIEKKLDRLMQAVEGQKRDAAP